MRMVPTLSIHHRPQVYPLGLPLLVFIMLFRLRDKLNPKVKDGVSEDEVIANRKEDAELAKKPIARFAMLYKPHFWGMEVRLSHCAYVVRTSLRVRVRVCVRACVRVCVWSHACV